MSFVGMQDQGGRRVLVDIDKVRLFMPVGEDLVLVQFDGDRYDAGGGGGLVLATSMKAVEMMLLDLGKAVTGRPGWVRQQMVAGEIGPEGHGQK